VIRRIIKYGSRDFYTLSKKKQLPSETINYVPKVLAAMHIVKNASKYGFQIPQKKYHLFDLTELTPVKRNTSLHIISDKLNVDVKLLKKLNPELKKHTTPRHVIGHYMLRIPKNQYSYNLADLVSPMSSSSKTSSPRLTIPESKKQKLRRTAAIDPMLAKRLVSHYRVKSGETLFSISRKFKTSPLEIAKANKFDTWKTKLKAGQIIKLSYSEEQTVTTKLASSPKVKRTNGPIVYRVSKGDNLKVIARLFNSPIKKIKKANNINQNKIYIGQKLILPGTQKAIYTVRRGDHLTKVAKEFNLPIETLVKINSLKGKMIIPGQKIIVNMD
jgi:membrane-bound lytic murein transglycosylase D